MKGTNFNRFKKKSLILLHEVLYDVIFLNKIKNLKILQTCQTFHLKQRIVEENTLQGHSINGVVCLIKIHDNKIVSSGDNIIKIWDVITGKCLKTLQHLCNCLIKINDKQIASFSSIRTIKIWDVITGNCLNNINS